MFDLAIALTQAGRLKSVTKKNTSASSAKPGSDMPVSHLKGQTETDTCGRLQRRCRGPIRLQAEHSDVCGRKQVGARMSVLRRHLHL